MSVIGRHLPFHLTEPERDCVTRYLVFVIDRLAGNLVELWLFGSAARGDMSSVRSPMRSDIDLLILTDQLLDSALTEELLNATYRLFLECGRQISPQFWTVERFSTPEDDRARAFVERVRAEGRVLHRRSAATPGVSA